VTFGVSVMFFVPLISDVSCQGTEYCRNYFVGVSLSICVQRLYTAAKKLHCLLLYFVYQIIFMRQAEFELGMINSNLHENTAKLVSQMQLNIEFRLSYRIGVEKRRLGSLFVLLLVSHFITITYHSN